ncbi:MAG: hypothetical protein ACJAYE_002009 [Candidatus Azotimanducaceae bacterium]|jgi:hypothetical protein
MTSGWQVTREQDPDLVVVTFLPPFTVDHIDQAEKELVEVESVRLLSFVECVGFSPTTTELLDIAKKSVEWNISNQTRIAWLAGSQAAAGLLRIITSRFSDRELKVFLSDTEARAWLAGDHRATLDVVGQSKHLAVRLRGTINLDDVMQKQLEVRRDIDYDPARPLLWDLRESRFTESLAEVQHLARLVAGNHNSDRQGHKSAVLVDSHLMDLLIREMAKASDWPGVDIVVFRSYKEAVAWLSREGELE